MFSQILTIARNTFIEAIRQPIVIGLVTLCGIFQWFNTWTAGYSMGQSTSGEISADNKLMLDIGLATVFGCGTLLAAFVATSVISREIEAKTILTVVSKPISRPAVVLGKYLGVVGCILLATLVMFIFLLMGVRHEVMSTAADTLDGPVIFFGFGAFFLSLALGALGNYFYGWPFPQTVLLSLAPLQVAAYLGLLVIGKDWGFQPITTDIKPQVLTGCAALMVAIMVLTAVAVTASTRLGQVMTIVTCAAVFVGGLLSNHLLGARAFQNEALGIIATAEPVDPPSREFNTAGATYRITLTDYPRQSLRPGDRLLYGPNPNGFSLASGSFGPFAGNVEAPRTMLGDGVPPAIIITEIDGAEMRIRNIGEAPVAVRRPPRRDDYIFGQPTRINPLAAAAWAIIPNMHFFWLLDPISQNRPVPAEHLGMLVAYGATQIGAILALGIALFQRRDVG
ncbi:MAG: ABC transporter permease [Phycisphaerales bacterium JB039]